MRTFHFSLHGLLRVREAQREACEQELIRARARQRQEQERLQALERQFQSALITDPGATVSCGYFLQREKYLARLKRELQEQRVKVSAAETEVRACMGRLRRADIELKKMEKLQQHERDRWQLDFQRQEQKINDEIGSSRAFYQRLE